MTSPYVPINYQTDKVREFENRKYPGMQMHQAYAYQGTRFGTDLISHESPAWVHRNARNYPSRTPPGHSRRASKGPQARREAGR